MTDVGKKWRQGIHRRLSKSSLEARRLTYLLLYLISRGFDAKTFETSLDEIQAFYSADFRIFSANRQHAGSVDGRRDFESTDVLVGRFLDKAVSSHDKLDALG